MLTTAVGIWYTVVGEFDMGERSENDLSAAGRHDDPGAACQRRCHRLCA